MGERLIVVKHSSLLRHREGLERFNEQESRNAFQTILFTRFAKAFGGAATTYEIRLDDDLDIDPIPYGFGDKHDEVKAQAREIIKALLAENVWLVKG